MGPRPCLFGCDFYQGYGQSEAPALTMMTPTDHRVALETSAQMLASVGWPQIGWQLQIVDAADHVVPRGAPGEVCIRSVRQS
jgi:acyl-CoA synthetase (AMP-forming)/AMP-acid ligase II